MEYRELPLPPSLTPWIAAVWMMWHDGAADGWIEHEATPDGCLEVILRTAGRSAWRGEQPECFATGISTRPIRFGFSGDAAFVAIKLWPWAWEVLDTTPCPALADGWIPLDPGHRLHRLLKMPADTIVAQLQAAFATCPTSPVPNAIRVATSVADIRRRTGLAPRELQRWFLRHIGFSARAYLRIRRFSDTLRALPEADAPLAIVAAERGYADQAHMARDFRDFAGTAPRRARGRAKGPFL